MIIFIVDSYAHYLRKKVESNNITMMFVLSYTVQIHTPVKSWKNEIFGVNKKTETADNYNFPDACYQQDQHLLCSGVGLCRYFFFSRAQHSAT